MSAKIEPLKMDPGDVFASDDAAHFFIDVSDCPYSLTLTRSEFAALVRWGAAALAVTHPARAPKAEPDAEC